MRIAQVIVFSLLLSGCAFQRAKVATEAKTKMVGLSKEQLLACMGPPAGRMVEGATEVWSYQSGDGTVVSSTSANVSAVRGVGVFGSAAGVSSRRFCQVNIAISAGQVSQVSYQGPTGGILTVDEQCAFVVHNCTK